MAGQVPSDRARIARRRREPTAVVPLEEVARRLDHAARCAGCGGDEDGAIVLELGEARRGRVVDGPAARLLLGGAAGAGLVGAGEQAFGLLPAPVEPVRVEEVERGVIEVVGLERAAAGGDGVVADGGGTLGPELADRARDLRRVARVRLALEQRPVVHQGLALLARQAAVVPEIDGGRRDAVDGAPGQEERVQRGQKRATREDAEGADEVVDDAGAAVVAVVGQELVGPRRIVDFEPVLGALPDDRVGVRVEHGAEGVALRVAREDEACGQVADVVGEAGGREAAGAALVVERGERRDVGVEHLELALEPVTEDQADALLDGRVGRRGFADEVVGVCGQREECEE